MEERDVLAVLREARDCAAANQMDQDHSESVRPTDTEKPSSKTHSEGCTRTGDFVAVERQCGTPLITGIATVFIVNRAIQPAQRE